MANTPAQFPQSPVSPLVTPEGLVTVPWQNFFIALWNRTGSGTGSTTLVLDSLGNAVPGVTLYRGPSLWQFLSIGASGQLYTVSPGHSPQWEGLSSLIDRDFGSSPGMIIYRSGAGWTTLAIGQSGTLLTVSPAGAPQWEGLSSLLDRDMGSATGDMLMRQLTGWGPLAPGTVGNVLSIVAGLPSWQTPVISTVVATGVNFNAATADTAIAITLATGFARYVLDEVVIEGASASCTTATFGMFSATGGGGTTLLAATACTVSTSADNAANNMQIASAGAWASTSYNYGLIYFRTITPEGSAATANVLVQYTQLP